MLAIPLLGKHVVALRFVDEDAGVERVDVVLERRCERRAEPRQFVFRRERDELAFGSLGRWDQIQIRIVPVPPMAAGEACGSCASTEPAPEKRIAPTTPTPAPSPARSAPDESGCSSFSVKSEGAAIDLARARGFVEACSQEESLCDELSARYPPIVRTVGYFWLSAEWAAHRSGRQIAPSRYLIAQISSRPADAFGDLKKFTRDRAGAVPDRSRAPELSGKLEKVNLGILDETDDSITIGATLKPHSNAADALLPPQVMTNTALLTNGHVLILYVHQVFSDQPDVGAIKRLTAQWLACLRHVE